MGREIKRVPIDFDWPLGEVWVGYLTPGRFDEAKCPDCRNGLSAYAEELYGQWHGQAPFLPESTGSTPLTADTPAVRAYAKRNVDEAPHFYGAGEAAVRRESDRLANLWNGRWSHHLSQADVDALVDAGRLRDFTAVPRSELQRRDVEQAAASSNSCPPYNNGHRPTAAEINEWSIRTHKFSALDSSYAVEARCLRDGQPRWCTTCSGHGTRETYPGQRAEFEAWEQQSHEPPPPVTVGRYGKPSLKGARSLQCSQTAKS